jgi:hypothetical protein
LHLGLGVMETAYGWLREESLEVLIIFLRHADPLSLDASFLAQIATVP